MWFYHCMKQLTFRNGIYGVLICVGLAVGWGCVTEPITGRSQLSLISASKETELGLSSFESMKKDTPINRDPANNALVQKVGKRIAAVAELPDAQWEFVVFESPEVNAFCLPGGKVGIYTGILPITKDEAGLATVIGHEVAHAAAHHGAERMSDALVVEQFGTLLNSGLSQSNPKAQALISTLYGAGTQVGVLLPFSRKQETSADEIGLIYMARAGYDPAAAVSFWERFAELNRQSGSQTPGFLRTHPLDETRIQTLKEWLPKARQEFRPQ